MTARALLHTKAKSAPEAVFAAGRLVEEMGGRYSSELGIDVDAGEAEVERWFLAATLFGTRISASIAIRTYKVLEEAGLRRIAQARHVSQEDLVRLLDQGGYARYDFRTASRLVELSEALDARYGGEVAEIGRRFLSYRILRDALDALPGWGPVTVDLFMRELRGVWPGAMPPLSERAHWAASHLGLLGASYDDEELRSLRRLASKAHIDLRDLESALVRLALAHHGRRAACAGRGSCVVLPVVLKDSAL